MGIRNPFEKSVDPRHLNSMVYNWISTSTLVLALTGQAKTLQEKASKEQCEYKFFTNSPLVTQQNFNILQTSINFTRCHIQYCKQNITKNIMKIRNQKSYFHNQHITKHLPEILNDKCIGHVQSLKIENFKQSQKFQLHTTD